MQTQIKTYIRKCKHCGSDVETTDRYATVLNCKECEDKKQAEKKDRVYIRKCLGCRCDVECKGHATIVYCKDCKNKKLENKRQKQLDYINRKHFRICCVCKNKEEVDKDFKPTFAYVCSNCKSSLKTFKRRCNICNCEVIVNNAAITNVNCDNCKKMNKNLKEPVVKIKSLTIKRPKFAKKKHYGYCGVASSGNKFWSLNEQDLEEWLTSHNINHIAHPRLGKSFKFADQYLPDLNLYLEIDGLRRTDDIDWNGKLSVYDNLNLAYMIIQPINSHFHDDKQKCFLELDESLKDVLNRIMIG
jgi:hypothetical protein